MAASSITVALIGALGGTVGITDRATSVDDINWRTSSHQAQNCCYLFLRFHDIEVDYRTLLREMPPTEAGTTFLQMRDFCAGKGLSAGVGQLSPNDLKTESLPVIVHFSNNVRDGGAFAVLFAMDDHTCFIVDGSTVAFHRIPIDVFRRRWSGFVLRRDDVVMESTWAILAFCMPWVAYAGFRVVRAPLSGE